MIDQIRIILSIPYVFLFCIFRVDLRVIFDSRDLLDLFANFFLDLIDLVAMNLRFKFCADPEVLRVICI